MLGSGSAPRTVPSPPTPELHKFQALRGFCLRLGDSSAPKRAARRALGGWAVEGVHVDPPLTSPGNNYAQTRIRQDPGASASSACTGSPSWACPPTPEATRATRLSSKIRSTSVPSTPALRSPGRSGGAGKEAEAPVALPISGGGHREGGPLPRSSPQDRARSRTLGGGDLLPFSRSPWTAYVQSALTCAGGCPPPPLPRTHPSCTHSPPPNRRAPPRAEHGGGARGGA